VVALDQGDELVGVLADDDELAGRGIGQGGPGPCRVGRRRPVTVSGPSPSHECLHAPGLVKARFALRP
jgi:hypothetical protein